MLRKTLLFAIAAQFGVPLAIADSVSVDLTSSGGGVYHYALHTPAHTSVAMTAFDSFFIQGLVNVTTMTTSADLGPFGCNFVGPPFGDVECNDGFITFDNSASDQPKDWGDLEVDAPGTILGTASFTIEHDGGRSVGSVSGPVALTVTEPPAGLVVASALVILGLTLRWKL
jgi:hypothetical protein